MKLIAPILLIAFLSFGLFFVIPVRKETVSSSVPDEVVNKSFERVEPDLDAKQELGIQSTPSAIPKVFGKDGKINFDSVGDKEDWVKFIMDSGNGLGREDAEEVYSILRELDQKGDNLTESEADRYLIRLYELLGE